MLTHPTVLLRIEEATLFILTVALYRHLHASWILFAVLFLAPDLFMLGYLAGPHVGAACYNFGHWLALPLALLAFGVLAAHPFAISVALIWLAHIFFDRILGYGFKYPAAFKDTHLQRI